MAHATFTADNTPLIKAVREARAEIAKLANAPTNFEIGASFNSRSMAAAQAQVKTRTQAMSKNAQVTIQARFDLRQFAQQSKKIRDFYAKAIQIKLAPYLSAGAFKTVKAQISKVLGAASVDVALKFQKGAASSFRATLRRMLEVLSRGSYVEVQMRATLLNKALANFKSKKLTLDVDVAPGTAAKIKSVLELFKSLRTGGHIPVRFDIDPAAAPLIRQLARDLKEAADQAKRVNNGVGQAASNAAPSAGGAGSGGGSNAGGAGEGSGSATSELLDKLTQASDVIGAGAVAGVGASLKIYEEFDAALRNVNSIAQLSEPNLQKLGDSIRSISSDPSIRKGPRDLATGLYEIYSVGFKGKEALDILRVSARGASAGLTDTSVAADALTSILSTGLKGASAPTVVMDALFQTVNDGKVSFSQLAGSIGQVLPMARAAGVSLQELGAFIAVSTTRGQSASTATTNLQNLISKLVNPSKESAKAFDALGIKYGYAAVKAEGFSAKLEEIQRKTGGNSDAVKRLLPDLQAQTGALTVLSDGMAGYNSMLSHQAQASLNAGAASRAAAKQNQGLSNDVAQAKKNLEEFSLTVATVAVPAATALLQRASSVMHAFKSLSPETQSAGVKLALYGGAALLAVGRIKSLIETVILARKAFIELRAAHAAATASNPGLWAGLGAAGFVALAAAAAAATLAVGLYAINQQKVAEKSANLTAANAGLEASTHDVMAALSSLGKVATINPASVSIAEKLTAQYEKLKGSAAGLAKFKSSSVLQAQREVFYNPKLKPLERAVLLDEIKHVQEQIDSQIDALNFKATVKAEADKGALANLTEAFRQTYGDLYNLWRSAYIDPYVDTGKRAFELVSHYARKAFIEIPAKARAAFVDMTGGADGWGAHFLGVVDRISHAIGLLRSKALGAVGDAAKTAWRAFNGQTANAGETDANAPSKAGFGPAWVARQKAAHATWLKANPAENSKFIGPPSRASSFIGPPTLPSTLPQTPIIALNTAAKRKAALEASRLAQAMAATASAKEKAKAERNAPARSAAEKAATQEKIAALKREKDALNDSAKSWDAQARAVEESAKRQIDALSRLHDTFGSAFSDLQSSLVSLGILNNPLAPLIDGFQTLLDLGGRSQKIIDDARSKISGFQTKAGHARERVETLSGLDGNVPGIAPRGLDAPSSTGAAIAAEAVAMQRKWGERIGKVFYRGCDRLADTTVNSATKAFASIMGPRGASDSAAKTMARFQKANIGFAADKNTQYAPGDIVYSGATKKNRAGHVQIVGPEGSFLDQYRAHAKPTTRPEWVVRAGGNRSGAGMGAAGAAESANGLQSSIETKLPDALDNLLGKFAAVPRAWGKAVDQSEDATARFQVQTLLASRDFQSGIETAAAKAGVSSDFLIKKLRDVANQADYLATKKRAVNAVAASLLDLEKQRRAVGKESNPFSSILAEFEPRGKFAAAPEKKIPMLDAQTRLSIEQTTRATTEAAKAESLKTAALRAAAPYLTEATAGTSIYARALENATRKIGLWQDSQIQGNLEAAKTFDEMGGASLRAAADLETAAKQLRASGLDFGGLSLILETSAAQKRAQGKGEKGRAAGIRADANRQVQTRDKAQTGAEEIARLGRLTGSANEFDFGAKQDRHMAQREREILLNDKLSTQQKQITLARAKYVHDTDLELRKSPDYSKAQIEAGAPRDEAERRAGKIDFGAAFKTDAITQFNAAQDEARKGLATFGDLSGLAGTKFDQASGALNTLTDAQQKQLLINQAAIAGLQHYGQEFDALYNQKFALAAENLDRQMGLTRGLSALEKQEMQWRTADAEQAARMATASQEEKNAYNQKRGAVEELRDSIRGLLKDSKALAAQDYVKNATRQFEAARQPNDIKRGRMELENQLVDSGDFGPAHSDPMTAKLLNLNELGMRADQSLERFKGYVSQVQGIFAQGFQAAFDSGPRGFFEGVAKGFADMVQTTSTQILSDALTGIFVKAFPQVGNYLDAAGQSADKLTSKTLESAGAATVAATAYRALAAQIRAAAEAQSSGAAAGGGAAGGGLGSILGAVVGGFFSGGGKSGGGDPGIVAAPSGGASLGNSGAISAAIGERHVPYDGAIYRLHAGESVLTRRETEQRAAIAASPGRSGGREGDGGSAGDAFTMNGNVIMPQGTDANNFARNVKRVAAPQMSRRSQAQAATDRLQSGTRHR